jgi:hypothetical protein
VIFAIIVAAVLAVLAIWLLALNAAQARLRFDDPEAAKQVRTIGQLIAATRDKPVHIIFVHGIRADGPGTAQSFMQGLCRHAPVIGPTSGGFVRTVRHPLGVGPWSQDAKVVGQTIWDSDKAWEGSLPFVDRYVFERAGAPPVVVDEVNWWPLLFPLKGVFAVLPEAQLAGPDKDHLQLLMRDTAPYFGWVSEEQYREAMEGPRRSGGGALINRILKQQLLDWGLADAVIALGPMRRLFRLAMDGAFDFAAGFDGRDVHGQEFVVVSESLGSFVVLDAASNAHGDAPRAHEVVSRTSDLWFLANQFGLLELARIEGLSAHPQADALLAANAAPPVKEPSPMQILRDWAAQAGDGGGSLAAPRTRQVVAFSDPSDILTFGVPNLPSGAVVLNVYDRNEINWFGLFVNPIAAHGGHSANERVLKFLFRT